METLDYIVKKFNIDLNQPSPIMLAIGRFKDIPKLLCELGFNKGAEIGVYRASYSRHLLDRNPNLQLIGVDAWEVYTGYKDYHREDIKDAHRESIEVYKKYGDRATLIQGWSNWVVKTIPDESLDFVFIDGNHAYEYVVEDIALWSKKVKKGGIIYGHDFDDYSNSRRWKDMNVINAVDGWMKSYKIKPWFVTTNNSNKCWLYVK
ncbi:class I SAM-dependent methyltransferase [Patescibacteria group bacterium]|nr:class I SAM-dependent methyltransferase [Patescibacteria group bacterium]